MRPASTSAYSEPYPQSLEPNCHVPSPMTDKRFPLTSTWRMRATLLRSLAIRDGARIGGSGDTADLLDDGPHFGEAGFELVALGEAADRPRDRGEREPLGGAAVRPVP